MKSIDKPASPDEAVRQDFQNELKNIDFPFKEIVISDNGFKEPLFGEFATLTAKPKENLYTGAFINIEELHKELQQAKLPVRQSTKENVIVAADFVAHGPLESKYYSLRTSFYKLLSKNKVPRIYYGRFLDESPTIKILRQINSKIDGLKTYIFHNTNVQDYRTYAEATADAILHEAQKITTKDLKNEIIKTIIVNNDNFQITAEYLNSSNSDIQRKQAIEKYDILKTHFNSYLNSKLNKIIDVEEDSSNSELTVSSSGYISYNGYEVNCDVDKGIMFDWFLANTCKLLAKHLYIQKLQDIFTNETGDVIENFYFVAHSMLETSIQQIRVEVTYSDAKKLNLIAIVR